MLQELIDHSPDLKRLFEEGYQLEWIDGHLVVRHIPYVNANREVKYGALVGVLTETNKKANPPNTHVIHFIGDFPCHKDGSPIEGLRYGNGAQLHVGLVTNHSFSNKPKSGYPNHYEKVKRYAEIISNEAKAIASNVKDRPHLPLKDDNPNSVFQYFDYNSSRAGINMSNQKLEGQKIGIIGLGGSGSYILDFVSKTQVAEIHLFDADVFMTHNAFRSPGAASIDDLHEELRKVEYHASRYSKMHKHIIPHSAFVSEDNLHELEPLTFIFLSMDSSEVKECIIEFLIEHQIPFVDVGMSVLKVDNQLLGQVRSTLVTPEKSDHWRDHISTSNAEQDEYATNIQVAELNAMNAVMAVIKWKKHFGFYQDLIQEHNSVYDINTATINNDEV